jgi:hypothetical protein
MSQETLINDSIVARIVVDRPRNARSHHRQTDFERIAATLRAICDPQRKHRFIIYGREHSVIPTRPRDKGTYWRALANGGVHAQIALVSVHEPAQRIYLTYKLEQPAYADSSSLIAEFNPTTILAGNNVYPAAIADPITRALGEYPSSHPETMQQIYRLGFDLLEELHDQATTGAERLYQPTTAAAIRSGDFHLIRAQWSAYLPTDVPTFLQVVGTLYGHSISKGKALIQAANYVGLSFDLYPKAKIEPVSGVMLIKKHGKKSLFSLVFYDKRKRIAQMKQGRSLLPAEATTIRDNVRFDITAHSLGIEAIVKAAQARLKLLSERGVRFPDGAWVRSFRTEEVKPTARLLQRAIFVLSHQIEDGLLVRRSIAKWLVPRMIRHVLALNILARFGRDNFLRLGALEDPVAVAWRCDEVGKAGAWAKTLAKLADCSEATVYSRRDAWLKEYGIDIRMPHALYRDVLYFGSASLTHPQDRSAYLLAVKNRQGAEAIQLSEAAARNFDRARTGIVGKAINSSCHPMEIKIARKTPVQRPRVRPHVRIGERKGDRLDVDFGDFPSQSARLFDRRPSSHLAHGDASCGAPIRATARSQTQLVGKERPVNNLVGPSRPVFERTGESPADRAQRLAPRA